MIKIGNLLEFKKISALQEYQNYKVDVQKF